MPLPPSRSSLSTYGRIGPWVALILICVGCRTEPDVPMKITVPQEGANIISNDVMARDIVSEKTGVQHILLGWRELYDVYGSRMDPRARERSFEQARAEIKEIIAKLEKEPSSWRELMRTHTEDPVAAQGKVYEASPKAKLTPPFRQMALRLQLNEVAVVGSKFGFHIMRRVE